VSKPIELSHTQWGRLREQLKQDNPPSVMIIRSRMKEKLGFTNRIYKDWDAQVMADFGGYRKNCVMLDFYSEKKRTFFLMKYSDFIQPEPYYGQTDAYAKDPW
jgi:hypothetical protein